MQIRRLLKDDLFNNIVALYGVQISATLFPLVTIPYLARVLGPSVWGLAALAQSFGTFLAVAVEYGFDFSATREAAQLGRDKSRLGELLASVLGAKVLLAAAVIVVAFATEPWNAALRDHPAFLFGGVVFGLAQGTNVVWYFQGIERMRLAAALEIGVRAASTMLMFVLIKSPTDGWRVPVLYALPMFLASLVSLVVIYPLTPFRAPSLAQVRHVLRSGWFMFLFRVAMTVPASTSLVLGFFAPPLSVGYYSGADRISRFAWGMVWPLSRALYPRMSKLSAHDREAAGRMAWYSLLLMAGFGFGVGAALFIGAPLGVRLLLGPRFTPAVQILRVLALTPPIMAVNNCLVLQWLIPNGFDREANRVTYAAATLSLGASVLLASRFLERGLAWAPVISESFAFLMLLYVLRGVPMERVSFRDAMRDLRKRVAGLSDSDSNPTDSAAGA